MMLRSVPEMESPDLAKIRPLNQAAELAKKGFNAVVCVASAIGGAVNGAAVHGIRAGFPCKAVTGASAEEFTLLAAVSASRSRRRFTAIKPQTGHRTCPRRFVRDRDAINVLNLRCRWRRATSERGAVVRITDDHHQAVRRVKWASRAASRMCNVATADGTATSVEQIETP